jgi:predicted RNA-binding Zn-ribbon protein involved in translation (DUF1610 family)
MISCPHCLDIVDEDVILLEAVWSSSTYVLSSGEIIVKIECPNCDKEFKVQADIQVELVSAYLVEEEEEADG